jgi:hypothetical protein
MQRGTRTRLLAEFGVIVLGVLTALTLETGWQRLQESSLEEEYVAAIRGEVAENIILLQRNLARVDSTTAGLGVLLESLYDGAPQERQEEVARVLQAATRSSYDLPLSRAVFEDLQSTGNLRLIRNTAVRREVSRAYAEMDASMGRLSSSEERLDSRLYNLVSGYEARYELAGPGRASETVGPEARAAWLRDVMAAPDFEAELSRELRRHHLARFYVWLASQGLERFLGTLDSLGAT